MELVKDLDNYVVEIKDLERTLQASSEKLDYAHAEIKQLKAENEQLKEEAKSAKMRAAEYYGACSAPPVPSGHVDVDSQVNSLASITDPSKQTAYLRSLTAKEREELFSKN